VRIVSMGDLDRDSDPDLYVSDADRIGLLRNDGRLRLGDITAASLVINQTWPVDTCCRATSMPTATSYVRFSHTMIGSTT
jgi:hypothetical protein